MAYILIGTIIWGIVWGIVVNKVIENKGYEENWFWWGFFFGIFALIVALTKQSINTTKVVIESSTPIKENMELLSNCILNNQVNVSSPVHIALWEIKKDAEKLVLFVDFINVSHKEISAIMFTARGFNAFGDIIRVNDTNFFDVIGQDLSIKPNECGKVYNILQDDAIRKVEVKVKKVCFADGTIVDDIVDEWINTNQSELKSIHVDCAKRENAQSKYYAIVKEHYWQCVCGFVNPHNTCAICGMQKSKSIKFTQENFDNTYSEYLEQIELERFDEERRRLDEERKIEQDKILKKKRNKKIIRISTLIIVVIIALVVLLNNIVIPNCKYNRAVTLIDQSNYEESLVLLESINTYKNSKDLMNESRYLLSLRLIDDGKYEEAYNNLCKIKNYKDVNSILKRFMPLPKKIIVSNDTGYLNTIECTYNELGDCIKKTMTSSWVTSNYIYDDGICIGEVITYSDGVTDEYQYEYVMEEDGITKNLISERGNIIQVDKYVYDDNNNCIKMQTSFSDDDIHVYEFEYDEYGFCKSSTYMHNNDDEKMIKNEYTYKEYGVLFNPDKNVEVRSGKHLWLTN